MTTTEYQSLQASLRNKLHNNNYDGNKREAYQDGIKSAMSLVRSAYLSEKGMRTHDK